MSARRSYRDFEAADSAYQLARAEDQISVFTSQNSDEIEETSCQLSCHNSRLEQKVGKLDDRIQYFDNIEEGHDKARESLERKLEKSRKKIEDLEADRDEPCDGCKELSKFQNKYNAAKVRYDTLKEDRSTLKEDHSTLKSVFSKLISNYKNLEERNKALEERCKSIEAAKEILTGDITKLRSRITEQGWEMKEAVGELNKRIREQEETIKKAQEDVYKAKASSGWTFEADATVNAELGSLERAIKDFCKHYAITTKGDTPLHMQFQAGLHLIADIASDDGLLALEDASIDKSAPTLMLTAWLTHFVYYHIVADPFFFVTELEHTSFVYPEQCVATGISRFLSMIGQGELLPFLKLIFS
jgi:DNA repair exonuclease SbcCD ATPase subunit